jgi:cholesterol transport system auxiliary component
MPQSAPGFSTARMAYVTDPPRIDYFAYHEWADTPARLLASAIAKQLDDSGRFAAVMSTSMDVRADYRLDTELQRLVQVFDAGDSRLELSVKVSLVDIENRSLLYTRSFTYTEAADRANAEAGVAAANRATGRFLDDLLAALTPSFASLECP